MSEPTKCAKCGREGETLMSLESRGKKTPPICGKCCRRAMELAANRVRATP